MRCEPEKQQTAEEIGRPMKKRAGERKRRVAEPFARGLDVAQLGEPAFQQHVALLADNSLRGQPGTMLADPIEYLVRGVGPSRNVAARTEPFLDGPRLVEPPQASLE